MRLLIGALALAACAPDAPPPGAPRFVQSVSGRATDLDGAGVGPANVTFCGAGRCYADRSDEDGRFLVPVGDTLPLAAYRVHVEGRPVWADRLVAVDETAAPELAFAQPIRTPRLPDAGPTLVSEGPAATPSSGGVSLTVPASTRIDFGFSNATAPNGKTFRAAVVPAAELLDSGPLDFVAALAPFGASTSAPVGVRIDGVALPKGAAVELLVLEDRYEQPGLGQMQVAARGHVSADGGRVETDPGEGITRLTWLGVRLVR